MSLGLKSTPRASKYFSLGHCVNTAKTDRLSRDVENPMSSTSSEEALFCNKTWISVFVRLEFVARSSLRQGRTVNRVVKKSSVVDWFVKLTCRKDGTAFASVAMNLLVRRIP